MYNWVIWVMLAVGIFGTSYFGYKGYRSYSGRSQWQRPNQQSDIESRRDSRR